MAVKNANKSTPWGYKKVFLKEQGRYVFIANKLVDRYQKNFLEKFGRLNFPSVKDCLSVHKGNSYFFVCDIKDAFGSVDKERAERYLASFRKEKKKSKRRKIYTDIDLSSFTLREIKKERKKLIDEYMEEIFRNLEVNDIVAEWGSFILKMYKNERLDWFASRYFLFRYAKYGSRSFKDINVLPEILEREGIYSLSQYIEEKVFSLGISNEYELNLRVGTLFNMDFLKDYFEIINFLSYEYHQSKGEDIEFKKEMTLAEFLKDDFTNSLIEYSDFLTEEEKKNPVFCLREVSSYDNNPFYLPYIEIKDRMINKELNKYRGAKLYNELFERCPELNNGSYYYDEGRRRLAAAIPFESPKISLFHEEGGLIQGSRCSPLIFEIYAVRSIDRDLKKLAEKYGLKYSRYRDDIIFSSAKKTIGKYLRKKIRKILQRHGFDLNPRKSKIVNLNKRDLVVLGAKINAFWDISITDEQRERMIFWEDLGMKSSVDGMLAWEKYLKEI